MFVGWGCRNDKNEAKADLDDIYADYQVLAEEGTDNLVIKAEFREGGADGQAISLDDIGTVSLDGEVMPGDSTKRMGFYYELYKPIPAFEGSHELQFAREGLPAAKTTFTFTPLTLITVLPDTVRRADLDLEFSGIGNGDVVQVLFTDTSSAGEGVNITDMSGNSRIRVEKEELAELYAGPVMLEIIRETQSLIGEDPSPSGRLQITYTLRRQLILAD